MRGLQVANVIAPKKGLGANPESFFNLYENSLIILSLFVGALTTSRPKIRAEILPGNFGPKITTAGKARARSQTPAWAGAKETQPEGSARAPYWAASMVE